MAKGGKIHQPKWQGQQWTLGGGGTNLLSVPHHDNTTCLNRSFFQENWLPRVGQLSGLVPHKRQDQANEWCNLTWWIHVYIVWEVCIAMYCSCEHDSKWWSPQHLHGFRIQPGLASTQTYKVRMIIIATYTRTTRTHCINTFQCCTICVHPTENQPGSLQR